MGGRGPEVTSVKGEPLPPTQNSGIDLHAGRSDQTQVQEVRAGLEGWLTIRPFKRREAMMAWRMSERQTDQINRGEREVFQYKAYTEVIEEAPRLPGRWPIGSREQ